MSAPQPASQSIPNATPEDPNFLLIAKIDNAKIVINTLQPLAYKKDLLATVTLRPTGIKFTVEESNVMQGNAFLQKELFQEYSYKEEHEETFSVSLSIVMECLQMYGSGVSMTALPALQLAYRGYGSPLLIMLEENDILTDCSVRTLECEATRAFNIRASPLACKVIIKSENLHDAFNELDWSNTRMSWLIADTQPYFRLATDGPNGSCQVDYPKDSEVFMVYESTTAIEFQYKLRLLQPSVKALTLAGKTQIKINTAGLLCMQHMIKHDENQQSFIDFYVVAMESDEDNE